MQIVKYIGEHPKRTALIIVIVSAIIAGIYTGNKAQKEKAVAQARAQAMYGGDAKVTLNAGAVLKDLAVSFIVLFAVMAVLAFAVEKLGQRSKGLQQGLYGQYQARQVA